MAFSEADLKRMASKGNKVAQQALSTYSKQRSIEQKKEAKNSSKLVSEKTPSSKVPLLIKNLAMAGLPRPRWSESPDREYMFHPRRRWRLDVFFPDYLVAIEVEGGIRSHGRDGQKSRHLEMKGFEEDAIKYFEAGLMGIFVIRVSSEMVTDGRAASMAIQALEARGYKNDNPNQAYIAFRDQVSN